MIGREEATPTTVLIALFVSAEGLRDAAHVSLELEEQLLRNRLLIVTTLFSPEDVVISGTHASFISTNIRLWRQTTRQDSLDGSWQKIYFFFRPIQWQAKYLFRKRSPLSHLNKKGRISLLTICKIQEPDKNIFVTYDKSILNCLFSYDESLDITWKIIKRWNNTLIT